MPAARRISARCEVLVVAGSYQVFFLSYIEYIEIQYILLSRYVNVMHQMYLYTYF